MAEDSSSPAQGKKKNWLKILLVLCVLFVLVVTGVFFYINSASFIRGQVFSRVQDELNQPVTAGEINFSVFSGIEIDDFNLGDDPLLKADKVKVSYELMPILSGELIVSEMLLENATMNVVINRDGTPNILAKRIKNLSTDSNGKKGANSSTQSSKSTSSEPPLNSLSLKNIKVKNLNLRFFKDDDKSEKVVEFKLKNFNFELPELKNGADFAMSLSGALECIAGTKFKLSEGVFEGTINSGLTEDFKPKALSSNFKVTKLAAQSEGTDLPVKDFEFNSKVSLEGQNLKVDEIKLKTLETENPSEVLVNGTISQAQEVTLSLNVNNVNASLLDLAAPFVSGNKHWQKWQNSLKEASQSKVVGFGETVIAYKAEINKSASGPISLNGEFELKGFPLVKQSAVKSISKFGVKLQHGIQFNSTTGALAVKRFSVGVNENGSKIVDVNSSGEVLVDTKTKQVTLDKTSPVTINLSGLNLDYAKPFLKEEDLQGFKKAFLSMNSELSSVSENQIKFSLKNFTVKDVAFDHPQLKINDISMKTTSAFLIDKSLNLTIDDLNFALNKGSDVLLSTALGGDVSLENFASKITVNNFSVRKEIGALVPESFKNQFGLENLNAVGSVVLSYIDGEISTSGKVKTENLGLAGELFNETKVSQTTNFKLSLGKDKNLKIEDIGIDVESDRFSKIVVKVLGNFALPSEGNISKSEITVNVPSIVDADGLLSLLKKQDAKTTSQEAVAEPTKPVTQSSGTPPETTAVPQVNLVFNSLVDGVTLQGQKISKIETRATLQNEKATLEKLNMLIGTTPLMVTGNAQIGKVKSVNLKVKTDGFIDISPVNSFINKGTTRNVNGLVELSSITAETKGSKNEEFIKNLVATGVINLKDIQLQKYANIPGILSTTADLVLGVNPDNIHFTAGKFDVAIKNKVVSLNECRVQGQAFMVNPTGTLALTETAYDVKLSSEAGFGGGKLIQSLMGFGGGELLQQLAGKSDSVAKFNQNFVFSDAYKLFTLKDKFKYEKSFPINKANDQKSVTADYLTSVITYAAEMGKMKNSEISRLQKITSGKGNVLEEALGLGIDRYNKKNKIDGDSEAKEGEPAKKKGLFDQLIDIGINEIDKREEKKEKKRAEKEGAKPEETKEEKKPDSKKQILEGLRGLFN